MTALRTKVAQCSTRPRVAVSSRRSRVVPMALRPRRRSLDQCRSPLTQPHLDRDRLERKHEGSTQPVLRIAPAMASSRSRDRPTGMLAGRASTLDAPRGGGSGFFSTPGNAGHRPPIPRVRSDSSEPVMKRLENASRFSVQLRARTRAASRSVRAGEAKQMRCRLIMSRFGCCSTKPRPQRARFQGCTPSTAKRRRSTFYGGICARSGRAVHRGSRGRGRRRRMR